MKHHVLYTTNEGPKTIAFDTAGDRQRWLNRMDDIIEDFYCLDIEGDSIVDAFTACMDCEP